jgi:hypothetical protein
MILICAPGWTDTTNGETVHIGGARGLPRRPDHML